jgi:DNA-binding LytR/AlgR family response regulator
LTDDIKVWIGQIGDISLLEACRNKTLVHLPDGKLLIRRSLGDRELRLDRSIFFRASRRYIVNLSHVKRLNMEKGASCSFSRTAETSPCLAGKAQYFAKHGIFSYG